MEPRGRKARIILGTLIPTLAIPVFLLSITFGSGDSFNPKIGTGKVLSIIFFVSFIALALTILPAIAYSLFMEHVLNSKINNSLITVLASTLAGFITGAQMYDYGWHQFGAIVGFASGVLLRAHFCYCQRISQEG